MPSNTTMQQPSKCHLICQNGEFRIFDALVLLIYLNQTAGGEIENNSKISFLFLVSGIGSN